MDKKTIKLLNKVIAKMMEGKYYYEAVELIREVEEYYKIANRLRNHIKRSSKNLLNN